MQFRSLRSGRFINQSPWRRWQQLRLTWISWHWWQARYAGNGLHWLPWPWLILATLALFSLFQRHAFDDPYITYRYAANIARGYGFVYNLDEPVLSTTAPLYALILALAGRVGLDIPLTSNALGCISMAAGGLAFWHLGQAWRAPLAGLTGLLLYTTFPMLTTTLGAETIFVCTLILGGFTLCAMGRYGWSALVFGLATLARPDSLLAVLSAALYVVWQRRFDQLWPAGLIYTLVLLPWVLFATAYFGLPWPVTLAAKQRQGLLHMSESFGAGLLELLQIYWQALAYRMHVLLAAAGLLFVLLRQRGWLLLIGWNILYLGAYLLLGVTSYFWYYAPMVIGFIALVAAGVELFGRQMRRMCSWVCVSLSVFVLVVGLLSVQIGSLLALQSVGDPRAALYQELGLWINTHTLPEKSIGTLEVGIIGYYADRPMIDFAGLLQPATAMQLTPETTYDDAAIWSFQQFQPDYIILVEDGLRKLVTNASFQQICRKERMFQSVDFPYSISIYTCFYTR
ncbi:MAG: hypothetical protein HC837_20040 [Chloroflexaceae bacterium]|nr:hypothetical protein [Chloroflexaceae bacterium]